MKGPSKVRRKRLKETQWTHGPCRSGGPRLIYRKLCVLSDISVSDLGVYRLHPLSRPETSQVLPLCCCCFLITFISFLSPWQLPIVGGKIKRTGSRLCYQKSCLRRT